MYLKHYVYALLDPRTNEIFYIGKGQGNRILAHTQSVEKGSVKSIKEKRIFAITNSGNKVRNIILAKSFETEEEALAIESLFILQGFNERKVLGINCDLTNEVMGHHPERYRPSGENKDVAGFEFQLPKRAQTKTKDIYVPLFDSILNEVEIFKKPNKQDGAYIRSQTLENGFEFVVFPKSETKITFEYIKRRPEDQHREQAEKLRKKLNLSGHYNDARIDYKDKSINPFHVSRAIASLRGFIQLIYKEDASLKKSASS